MATTWTWAQIISNIEGIVTRTSGNSNQTATNRWDVNGTDGAWMYIPENGYYTTGYKVTIPWAQIKSKLGNASDGHVLTGIKYSSQNGIMRTGNIANNGKTDHTFTPSKDPQTWSIPTGYHNGGVVTCKAISLSGNAEREHVLSGKIFYKKDANPLTGSMANKGALNWTPSGGDTTSVAAGYYSGGTLDSRTAYNNGYSAGEAAGKSQAQSKMYNVFMERSDNNVFHGRLDHIPRYQNLISQDVNFCLPYSWDLNDTTNGVRQLSYDIQGVFLTITSSGNTFNSATDNTFNIVIKPKYRFDVWATAASQTMIEATVNGIENVEDANAENWGFFWYQQRIIEGGSANTRAFKQRITFIDKSSKIVRIQGTNMKSGENYHLIIFSRY